MNGPSPDLVDRFRADCAALTGERDRLGIALSGGPDSVALLLLAQAAFPGRVEAATVDHGLRPESAAEAAFAARLCGELGVPHAILAADEAIAGNVQSAARALRYRLLAGWARAEGIAALLTAHHQDDQAETLLMRLQRGAGLSGVSGVRAATRIAGVAVARPLLGWPRAKLAAIVAEAGIEPVQDPSNTDEQYDRARLRRLIAEAGWIDAVALARSAAALAEADQAIEWALERLIGDRLRDEPGGLAFDPAGIPAELRRRALLHILARLVPGDPPRGEAVQRLLAALDAGETATLAGVRCAGGALWRFAAEPPRRSR